MLLRSQSNSRWNFAKRLAVVTYTEEEQFESNVNGKAGKNREMEKIKDAVFLLYPLDVGEETTQTAWKDCINVIDEAGKELHRKKKKMDATL